MKFALIYAEPTTEFAKRHGPEAPAYWGAWAAYIGAMQAAGVMTSGAGLEPPASAATLRVRGGVRTVQDGPFADAKEMLGGFVILDVADMAEAMEWAARSPAAASGAVEVRPVLPPPPAP